MRSTTQASPRPHVGGRANLRDATHALELAIAWRDSGRSAQLQNREMARQLEDARAVDVRALGTLLADGTYELQRFLDHGVEYCDPALEVWIYSIGIEPVTARIVAATDTRFLHLRDSGWHCLWLR